jgi:peptide/nickel transport system permease protein
MVTHARFVIRRLATAVVFVFAVAIGAFVLVRLAPGDATTTMVLAGESNEAIAAARARLGLDQSVPVHLAAWLGRTVRLDLGESSRFGRPVSDLLADRIWNTALLATTALALAVALGLPLGLLTGTRPRSWATAVVTIVSVLLISCPPIIGTLGLLMLAAATGWLSGGGHLALPVLALALPLAATLERLQSQAAAETLAAPDIKAAAARGLTESRLIWLHVGRQSLRPVLGVSGLMVASLFSGSIAVETITNWPGIGRLMLDGLVGRDLYLVAGCAMAGAVMIAVANTIADMLRAAADPRARHAA